MADELVTDKEGRAFVKNANGDLFRTSADNARALIATGDRAPATPEEVAKREAERLSSTGGALARGAAAGLVGGALAVPKIATSLGAGLLGAEDPLADYTGRGFVADAAGALSYATADGSLSERTDALDAARTGTAAKIRADLDANPLAFGAGEIGGQIVGAGGLAGAARIGGVAAAARLGLAGRSAAIAAAGTAGFIEGGALGGELAHEEAWVRDEKATAGQTLAGIGLGALFGGAGGAGVTALLTRGAARAESRIAAALGEEVGDGEALALAAPAREATSGLDEAAVRFRGSQGRQAPEMGDAARSRIDDAVADAPRGDWRGRVANKLDDEAIEAVARQNQPAVRALSRNAAERSRLGRVLNELDITGARKSGGIVGRSAEEMLEKSSAIAEARGKELGDGLEALSRHMGPVPASEPIGVVRGLVGELQAKANTSTELAVAERLTREVATWEERLTGGAYKTTGADELGRRLVVPARPAGLRDVSLREVHSLRRSIDQLIKYERKAPTPADEALQELRGRLEKWIESKVDAIGKENGADELVARYRRTKDEFRASRWASETLEDRLVRDAANRKLSLSDYVAGGAGAAAAAAGSPLSGLVLGGAAALANKAWRERGSNTVIALGRKLLGESVVDPGMAPAAYRRSANAIGDIVDGVQEHVDSEIGRFLGGRKALPAKGESGGGPSPSSSGDALRKGGSAAYAEHAREVMTVATDPHVAAERLGRMLGPEIANAAPGLYGAMAAASARAAAYLAEKLPSPPTDPESVTPHLDAPPPVSPMDLHAYAERVEGVEAPMSLLADLNKGRVSPEKVEAVKAVHPELFETMRSMVWARLADRTKEDGPLSYAKRRVLDLALDGDGALEPSLRPSSLAVMAEVGRQASQQQQKTTAQFPQISKSIAPMTAQLSR